MSWLRFPLFALLATVTLLAQQPTITAVLNIGSADARLSPGLIAVVSGTNFGPGMTGTVGGQNAPVTLIVGSTIATIQIPYSAPLGPSSVVLQRGGLNSSAFSLVRSNCAANPPRPETISRSTLPASAKRHPAAPQAAFPCQRGRLPRSTAA